MAGRRRSGSRPDEEPSGGESPYGGEELPDDGGGYGGEEPQGPGNPDADPVQIHREYVERRLGGAERMPPAEFRRVEVQWQDLPGAIRRPPVELPSEQEPEAPRGERSDGPA